MSVRARMEQARSGALSFSHRAGTWRWKNPDTSGAPEPVIESATDLVVTLKSAQGAVLKTTSHIEIRCLSGSLWIAETPGFRDTVLEAGRTHAIHRATGDIVLSSVCGRKPVTLEIIAAHDSSGDGWWPLQDIRPGFRLEIR